MSEMPLQFFLSEDAKQKGISFSAPKPGDAGFDLPTLNDVEIAPRTRQLLATGIHLGIPMNWVGLIRDRSSVAMRGGVVSAGVIDASYRGEVKVLLHNISDEPLVFKSGERIAQCLLLPYLSAAEEVDTLESLGDTERGPKGFGSTGA